MQTDWEMIAKRAVVVTVVLVGWVATFSADSRVVSFVVSPRGAYEPAINNRGEIVYVASTTDGTQWSTFIESTSQGRLSGFSDNVRFPDINDGGEVIYTDVWTNRLTVISTTRGPLFPGNLASINKRGRISAQGFTNLETPGPYTPGLLLYDRHGVLHDLIGAADIRSTGISRSREVTYVKRDALLGRSDVFSTVRGQLTFSGNVSSHAADSAGRFIYTVEELGGAGLFSQTGERLWDGPVGHYVDINDHGDIVFNVPTTYEENGVIYEDFSLVLLTSRPKFYKSRYDRGPTRDRSRSSTMFARPSLSAGALAYARSLSGPGLRFAIHESKSLHSEQGAVTAEDLRHLPREVFGRD